MEACSSRVGCYEREGVEGRRRFDLKRRFDTLVKRATSPIIPSAPKCSGRHFVFHVLSNLFPSKPSIAFSLHNHTKVSLTTPLGN